MQPSTRAYRSLAKKPLVALLPVVFFSLLPAAAQEHQGRLERRGPAWYFRGGTPFGTVVGVAAWVETEGVLAYVNVKHELLKDASGRGEVSWAPAKNFPDEGLYAMLDLTSGVVATGGWEPGGNPRLEVFVTPGGKELRISGAPSVPTYIVLLVARPGRGVWVLASPEGSTYDHDGEENGAQLLSATDVVPLADAQPLEVFAPGDHLVVAELRTGVVIDTVVSGR